jgi:hypothetical protein
MTFALSVKYITDVEYVDTYVLLRHLDGQQYGLKNPRNHGIYPVATFATLIYKRSCHCCIFYGNMKTGKFNGPGRLNHGFSGLPVDVSV